MIHILLPENREDGPVRIDRLPPLDRPALVTIHDLPDRRDVEIFNDSWSATIPVWKWRRKAGA